MALNHWEKTAPPRANKLRKSMDFFFIDSQVKLQVENLPKWKIDTHCKDLANKGMQRGFFSSEVVKKT